MLLLVIGFGIGVVSARSCQHDSKYITFTETVTISDTVKGDTVLYPVYYQVPDVRETIVVDTFTANVDTAAILSDYFKINRYRDTIDTHQVKIVLIEDVYKNRILFRQMEVQNYRVQTITNIVNQQRSFYMGIRISSDGGITPTGIMRERKHLYLVGYDVVNKGFEAGYAYRLK